jgi:hypothetical protein
MARRIELKGRYKFVNQTKPQNRADNKNDTRHIFYEAMLRNNTFEDYEADVGDEKVVIRAQEGTRLVTGHDEIMYVACDRGWIVGIDMAVPRWRRG